MKKVLLVALLSLATFAAQADDKKIYLTLDVGQSKFSGALLSSPNSFRIAAGKEMISPKSASIKIDTELFYTNAGEATSTDNFGKIGLSAYSLGMDALVGYDIAESAFSVGGLLGVAFNHAAISYTGAYATMFTNDSAWNVDATYGAFAKYRITEHLNVFAKYTSLGKFRVNTGAVGCERTNTSFGVGYLF